MTREDIFSEILQLTLKEEPFDFLEILKNALHSRRDYYYYDDNTFNFMLHENEGPIDDYGNTYENEWERAELTLEVAATFKRFMIMHDLINPIGNNLFVIKHGFEKAHAKLERVFYYINAENRIYKDPDQQREWW